MIFLRRRAVYVCTHVYFPETPLYEKTADRQTPIFSGDEIKPSEIRKLFA